MFEIQHFQITSWVLDILILNTKYSEHAFKIQDRIHNHLSSLVLRGSLVVYINACLQDIILSGNIKLVQAGFLLDYLF